MRRAAALLTLALAVAACTSDGPGGVEVADGWTVEVVRTDLEGPTQLTTGSDEGLLLGELAGGEDEGAGRVVRLDGDGAGQRTVVAEGLLTPTGVAAPGGRLLVQEQRRLVAPDPAGPAGAVEVLLEGLPSNGRSQGTLTVVPDDGTLGAVVLAVVTGRGSGPERGDSGQLLAVDLADGSTTPVAVGFKNAYAHAVGPDGTLYVTEIGDGSYDGEAPDDELNAIPEAVWRAAVDGTGAPYDGGWPECTGPAFPTEELGATAAGCAELPFPLATFPPRSTPTSVAVTGDGRVLVALWVEGRVVEVDPATGAVTDVLTGVGNPQHLLAMPDGTVLLTVHDRGELWRLTPP